MLSFSIVMFSSVVGWMRVPSYLSFVACCEWNRYYTFSAWRYIVLVILHLTQTTLVIHTSHRTRTCSCPTGNTPLYAPTPPPLCKASCGAKRTGTNSSAISKYVLALLF